MSEQSPVQLDRRISRFLDGSISPAESAELEATLSTDADARRRYHRQVALHALLRWEHAAPVFRLVGADAVAGGRTIASHPTQRRLRPVFAFASVAAAVAAIMLISFIMFRSQPAPPALRPDAANSASDAPAVAMLSNVSEDARWASTALPTVIGSDLRPGTLSLASGTAQVMFRCGAVVDMTGPCTLAMVNEKCGLVRDGLIHAYVPERAHGFSIRDPRGVEVVDLGTEFSFRVAKTNATATDLRVTQGRVLLNISDDRGKLFYSHIVSADSAARVNVDRSVALSRTIPLPGTGQGGFDIVAASGDPAFAATKAVVLGRPDSSYVQIANSPVRWVGLPTPNANAVSGAVYTFRTTVDLTGYDPATAAILGSFAVDNTVTAIRINGQPIHGFATMDEGFRRMYPFAITSGFNPGVNVVEFDVLNGKAGDPANPMALRVDWSLSAIPQVVKTPENKSAN